MRSQYYVLAVIGIMLAACSPRVRSVDASSDVVFVPLSEEPKDKRNADRVVIGMSRQQVDAIMGPSVKTCWIYPAGNFRQKVCFSDDKVTSVARTEHVPGTDRALIDATFATDTSISHSVPPDIVAVGASPQHVRRLWGGSAGNGGTIRFGRRVLGDVRKWQGDRIGAYPSPICVRDQCWQPERQTLAAPFLTDRCPAA